MEGVRLLNEDRLAPELPFVRRLGRGGSHIGWYLQQLLKLAAVEQAETPYCRVLDADVVAVRRVSDRDLVVGDRALRPRESRDTHPSWIRNAASALGVEPLDYSAAVTPSVLARDAVRLLADHAAESLRPRKARYRIISELPGFRRRLGTWRSRLLGVLPWTEYQLYDTFLVRSGRFEQFHVYTDDPVLYGNSVWRHEDFADWNPLATDGPEFSFSVVQGALGIPVEDVESRLRGAGLLA